jgi:putative hydrolase of the HAD superfamily
MEKIIFLPFRHLDLKNIIFDLGGVILNIDFDRTYREFARLGFDDFDKVFTLARQSGVFDKLDMGLITPGEFRDEIRRISGKSLTDSQIDKAWNALLLDFPPQRIAILENLKPYYRTFLLSNTNTIHCEVYNKSLRDRYGVNGLQHYFEKVYYSHEVHLRKPDAAIFELVLGENSLKPEETLFIDDTEQHVNAARHLGINAYHLLLDRGEAIDRLFGVV